MSADSAEDDRAGRDPNLNAQLSHIAQRIRMQLRDIEEVLDRIEEGWKRAENAADSYYLDGVALNLHGFYSGLERILELIAVNVDGWEPTGQNWHQELLRRMSEEVQGLRPAVISGWSYSTLNEYRGFRHIVRNIYTYNFDPPKIKKLVVGAEKLFRKVRAELLAFADFIEQAR